MNGEDDRIYFEIEDVASIRYPRIDDEVFSRDVHQDSHHEISYVLRQRALDLLEHMKQREVESSHSTTRVINSRTTHTTWHKQGK